MIMRLLLAEDEKELSRAVRAVLEHTGYEVDAAYDGEEAVELARGGGYDCMILDIMMPKMDGIEALRRIRASGDLTPVIMLTAKAEVDDRITGLDAGADDYLTKPFSMGELTARIRSRTRRKEDYTPRLLEAGNVKLDLARQEISGENAVRLSKHESALMEYLMLNRERALPSAEILRHVWDGEENASEEVVWVYISYLRTKLQAVAATIRISGAPEGPFCLETGAQG